MEVEIQGRLECIMLHENYVLRCHWALHRKSNVNGAGAQLLHAPVHCYDTKLHMHTIRSHSAGGICSTTNERKERKERRRKKKKRFEACDEVS